MERIREFLETSKGKALALALIVVAAGVIALSVWSSFGASTAARQSSDRMFICAKTGKTFWYTIKKGDSIPIHSKFSGEDTGYPAELCYWNADGSIRKEGVPVLLNQYKGESGPTFCPDCGRLVVGHNPPANPDRSPPPTKEEYLQRRGN